MLPTICILLYNGFMEKKKDKVNKEPKYDYKTSFPTQVQNPPNTKSTFTRDFNMVVQNHGINKIKAGITKQTGDRKLNINGKVVKETLNKPKGTVVID